MSVAKKPVASATEEDIYEALDLQFIEPELRLDDKLARTTYGGKASRGGEKSATLHEGPQYGEASGAKKIPSKPRLVAVGGDAALPRTKQPNWNRKTTMKKPIGVCAIFALVGAQLFAQAANAAPTYKESACTYDGYPCSDWKGIQDKW